MGLFHHLGTFLLLASAVLLLIATISAPVVKNIALLKVVLANNDVVSFGTFGYCIQGQSDSSCTKVAIGYQPLALLETLTTASYGTAAKNTAHALTSVQILHPVACGLAFLAFLATLGSSVIGTLFASALAALAWLVALVVMVTDFVAWGIVRDKVNGGAAGAAARFDTAIWCVLAAVVALFFASFAVLFSCCGQRRSRSAARMSRAKAEPGMATQRRRFWQRRERY